MERAIAAVVLAATVVLLGVALAPTRSRRIPIFFDREHPLSLSPPDRVDEEPDEDRNGVQCETTIAIDPLDERHVVGASLDEQLGTTRRVTRWYTTFDGGETWTTGTVKVEPGYVITGDPVILITPTGTPV